MASHPPLTASEHAGSGVAVPIGRTAKGTYTCTHRDPSITPALINRAASHQLTGARTRSKLGTSSHLEPLPLHLLQVPRP